MISEAERRFPARIRIAVPPAGLGRQLDDMTAWLDANCGAGNWAMTPSGLRGVVNDALAIYQHERRRPGSSDGGVENQFGRGLDVARFNHRNLRVAGFGTEQRRDHLSPNGSIKRHTPLRFIIGQNDLLQYC
jgi:hypothetical protein